MALSNQVVIIDTAGFFAQVGRLRELLEEGATLATVDFVVFEFVKVVESELNRVRAACDAKRKAMLGNLRERFPRLLRDLNVEVRSPEFGLKEVEEAYSLILEGSDAGDAMIWLKMRKLGWNSILTDDVTDWRKLGARVIPVR